MTLRPRALALALLILPAGCATPPLPPEPPRAVEAPPRAVEPVPSAEPATRAVTPAPSLVDGWTVIAPCADTITVHVSSSTGDDGNDGLSPAKAKRSIAAGVGLLRDRHPDHLLLKRGDTWKEGLGHWKKSGRSAEEPMLVSTYGSAAERPRLLTGAEGAIRTMPGGGSPPTIDDLALIGLHFEAEGFTGSGDCVGARILQPGSRFLVEDCVFEGYGTNLVFQAYSSSGPVRHKDFKLRRSTIVDAHCVHGTGAHPQGLYALSVDGLLIEECLFDHNGWSESVPGAGADVFSHDLYVDNDNSDVVVRGNIIANAASHGLQLRCGGTVVDNLFVRNSIALLVGGGNAPNPGGVRAEVRGNVVLDGKNIDDQNPRGWGMCFANIASGRVHGNVIANNTRGTQPVAMTLDGRQKGDTGPSLGVHDLVIDGNVLFDWSGGVAFEGDAKQIARVAMRANVIQDLRSQGVLVDHFDEASVPSVEWTDNRFHSRLAPKSEWMRVGGSASPLAGRQRAGKHANALGAAVSYPDPERSLASYDRTIGGPGTAEDFLDRARKQSRAAWRPELTASAVNRYLRAGFGLTGE